MATKTSGFHQSLLSTGSVVAPRKRASCQNLSQRVVLAPNPNRRRVNPNHRWLRRRDVRSAIGTRVCRVPLRADSPRRPTFPNSAHPAHAALIAIGLIITGVMSRPGGEKKLRITNLSDTALYYYILQYLCRFVHL